MLEIVVGIVLLVFFGLFVALSLPMDTDDHEFGEQTNAPKLQ